jgi:hypothetical protein
MITMACVDTDHGINNNRHAEALPKYPLIENQLYLLAAVC